MVSGSGTCVSSQVCLVILQQTQDVEAMLVQRWSSGVDGVPMLNRR